MATETKAIVIGAGQVSLSAYVTAAGAGAFTDVGHTKGPVTLKQSHETYKIQSERAMFPLAGVPTGASAQLKVPMIEATSERLRAVLKQPTANLSGGPTVGTLLVGDPVALYHQIKVVVTNANVGATAPSTTTETWLFYKSQVSDISEIGYAKGGERMYEATFDLYKDESVATLDKVYNVVIA